LTNKVRDSLSNRHASSFGLILLLYRGSEHMVCGQFWNWTVTNFHLRWSTGTTVL